MKSNKKLFSINDLRKINAQIESAHKDNEWSDDLVYDQNGSVKNEINNYVCYLTKSPKYRGQFRYNDFTKQKEFKGKEMDDFDLFILYNDIERDLGLTTRVRVDSALMEVFYKNRYNPIVDYLNGVEWDGQKRVESLFIDLLDADDTKLNRYMTKIWFIAAVKRIFESGCKFDNMIVLQGEQGIGKSAICDLISLNYSNNVSLNEIGNKDLINKLNRTWIAVVDELDSFNKKEMSNIKTFISNTKDTARLAFGKFAETYLRHCVFIGSTNDTTFLRDNTSVAERRFWVIKCNKTSRDSKVFDVLTKDYIDQLWAESMYYYKGNPNMYLDLPKDLQDDFKKEMEQFKTYNEDAVIDYVKSILEKSYKLNDRGEFVDVKDFLEQYNGNVNYCERQNSKIRRIPYSYLRFVLKSVYNEERTGKYIANGLGDMWVYKTIRYKDAPCKGFECRECDCDGDLFSDRK